MISVRGGVKGFDNLSAYTALYTLKFLTCVLTSFYLRIIIKLLFHHKYYLLKFSQLELFPHLSRIIFIAFL